jgi:hypothetical protein
MLFSLKDLRGYEVHASDGIAGKVYGAYLEVERKWHLRYLTIDLVNWIQIEQVLVPLSMLKSPDQRNRTIFADSTIDEVQRSHVMLIRGNIHKADKIIGCVVQAGDARIGIVNDLMVDFPSWEIKLLVLGTDATHEGPKVILIEDIKGVKINEKTVFISENPSIQGGSISPGFVRRGQND